MVVARVVAEPNEAGCLIECARVDSDRVIPESEAIPCAVWAMRGGQIARTVTAIPGIR